MGGPVDFAVVGGHNGTTSGGRLLHSETIPLSTTLNDGGSDVPGVDRVSCGKSVMAVQRDVVTQPHVVRGKKSMELLWG